jgi:hypothetical protein
MESVPIPGLQRMSGTRDEGAYSRAVPSFG